MQKLLQFSMLRLAVVTCALAGGVLAVEPSALAAAPTPVEQAVLAPVQMLFDGMAKHDQSVILPQVLPGGNATLGRNGKFLQMTLQELAGRVGKAPANSDKFKEEIHDPLVKVDDNIAVVWAAYTASLNGKPEHCGTDLFSLVKQNGHWLIASIVDNSRPCAAK